MEIKQQILFGLMLFLAPIVVDATVDFCRSSRRYRLNDLITNVTLALLTAMAGAAISVATLAAYIHVQQNYGFARLSTTAASSWILGFLTYDLLYYWAHRCHHRVAWLWAVHEVHHSGEDMNFGLAIRQSAFGGATTWFFFLPMALIGIPIEIFLGVTTVQLIFQYSIHNTFIRPLGWLEWILVTPSQHRVHHGRNQLYIDKNYGNVMVIWDRLWGTYQPEVPEHPAVYGLRRSVRSLNPILIHFHAGIELWRKATACNRFSDKLLCFVREPAWQPASVHNDSAMPHADDGPSAEFRKYDPTLTTRRYAYCLLQLAATGALSVFLLQQFEQLSTGAIVIILALILSTAWVLGSLLEGKTAYWCWEPLRFAIAGVVGMLITVM